MIKKYNVFHRTWWRENSGWPNGLEPEAGKRHYLIRGVTSETLAQQICRDWNGCHEPGKLSDKAEYDSA